jgi:hypothetical protein
VSILVRVTKAILLAMKARKPAVPMQAYGTELAVLDHAIRARHKPTDPSDCTSCVIWKQPLKQT